jgi:hypothetical protein
MPPGRLAVAAFVFACLTATPSLADCAVGSQIMAEGARSCSGEVLTVCSAGELLATTRACKMTPGTAPQATFTTAPEPAPPVAPGLIHIKAATYRAGGTAMDLVYRLREMCDHRQTCTVTGDAALLQGAPRGRGQFSVVYACLSNAGETDTRQLFFAQDQSQALSCRE